MHSLHKVIKIKQMMLPSTLKWLIVCQRLFICSWSLLLQVQADTAPIGGLTHCHRDRAGANHAYRCAAHCKSPPTCQHEGFVDRTCRCVCLEGVSGDQCENAPANYSYYGEFCGDANVTEAGTISSQASVAERKQRDCYWLVTAPEGSEVLLTFDHVSMNTQNRPSRCTDDQLAVSLKGDLRQPTASGCGNQLSGKHYRSVGGRLLVHFRTKGATSVPRHFKAHVSFIPAE